MSKSNQPDPQIDLVTEPSLNFAFQPNSSIQNQNLQNKKLTPITTAKKGINNYQPDSQPREKLASKGASVLSKAELIAILIGSGNADEDAIQLSTKILDKYNNDLNQLAMATITDLQVFKGIGLAKAVTIAAAMELCRRKPNDNFLNTDSLTTIGQLYQVFRPRLENLAIEKFEVIYLNRASKLLKVETISSGGYNATIVDVKVILENALACKAHSIALGHNHPSGNMRPSPEDIAITQKIVSAAKLFDIRVLDHIIIGYNQYFSFYNEAILPK